MKRFLITFLATIPLLLPATAGAATGTTPVDPSIMQPPLEDNFTWRCWRIDHQTVCDGERHDSWMAADTGLPCPGATIYSTATDDRSGRRWGDADGRALHEHFVADIKETLALDPEMTGTTAQGIGRFSLGVSFAVPGDLSTRVVVQSGSDATVVIPGTGLVIHDVGVKAFDIDENVVFAHGQHEVLDDFDGAFAKVCDALGG